MNRFLIPLCGFCIFAAASITIAAEEFIPRKQTKPPGPPLSPEEAIAKMTVPQGFSVELVASEPDLVNPVAMTFDERGRIWVTESLEYPRRSPGPGRDRVKILEDTTGDGKADKVTIFAEGLNIPSGIAVGHGGVWVANAPDLLFMQDTDGDDKADKIEVVVTGFGRTDTHELPNSLTWGPDGWLYGLNGVFNYSKVTQNGKTFDFTCAMFRVHPRTREFQLFCEGTSNPWGIAFDPEGEAFVSACVIDHMWHLTESGYYHRQAGAYPQHTWKIESIVDHKHQLAAYCGLTYFDSPAYPEEYRDRLYMGNIHGGCINVDELRRVGSTYHAVGRPDFLTANDVWFMPVVQKTGPDGCLYVLDWYDRYHCYQDANHDPEGIDRLKGRLYRVRYQQTPRRVGFDLAASSDEELIERLKSPNVYDREIATRLLSERGLGAGDRAAELFSRLYAVTLDEQLELKYRMAAVHAMVGAGFFGNENPRQRRDQMLSQLLKHQEPAIRAWGVRAANELDETTLTTEITSLAVDDDPRVRLQVAIAAPKLLSDEDAVQLLTTIAAQPMSDELLPRIIWQNLHPLLETRGESFVRYLKSKGWADKPGVKSLVPRAIDRLLSTRESSLSAIAALFNIYASGDSFDATIATRTLEIVYGQVLTGEIDRHELTSLKELLQPLLEDDQLQARSGKMAQQLQLLAAAWGDEAAQTTAREALTDGEKPSDYRIDSLRSLIVADDQSLPVLSARILKADAADHDFLADFIDTLATVNNEWPARTMIAALPEMDRKLVPTVANVLTQRLSSGRLLVDAVREKQIPKDTVNATQLLRLINLGDASLKADVESIWGTVRTERSPEREFVVARMKRVLRETRGDPFAGRQVFNKVCAQCHKLYGEGKEVGPDLTRNGRNEFHQLLSNVYDPNLVIGPAYQARLLITTEGRSLSGLIAEENEQRVVLRLPEGKSETIPREEIELMEVSSVSLMPEGLEKQMTRRQTADLFAYLMLSGPPEDQNAVQLSGLEGPPSVTTSEKSEYSALVKEIAPGFSLDGNRDQITLHREHWGRKAVLVTHPWGRNRPAVLKGTVTVPQSGRPELELTVGVGEKENWRLEVVVNGKSVLNTVVDGSRQSNPWRDYSVDLTSYSGEKAQIELRNHAHGWNNEHAYWYKVDFVTHEVPQSE